MSSTFIIQCVNRFFSSVSIMLLSSSILHASDILEKNSTTERSFMESASRQKQTQRKPRKSEPLQRNKITNYFKPSQTIPLLHGIKVPSHTTSIKRQPSSLLEKKEKGIIPTNDDVIMYEYPQGLSIPQYADRTKTSREREVYLDSNEPNPKRRKLDPKKNISLVPTVRDESTIFENDKAIWIKKGFELIIGKDDHLDCMLNLIKSAKFHILISSHSVNFLPQEIFYALKNAVDRGIQIDVRSPTIKYDPFNEEILYRQYNVHGKHLIIDKEVVVIGSFNWLDISEDSYAPQELSIFIKNENSNQIYGKIMQALIRYETNNSHISNDEPTQKRSDIFLKTIDIEPSSQLHILTTLAHHEQFLRCICKNAIKTIKVYSPFLKFYNARERLKIITDSVGDDVKIEFLLNHLTDKKESERLIKQINNFIKSKKLEERVKVTKLEGFHYKTIIVDGETLSIGSFNWLSSSRDEESEGHNQDTTIVLQGLIAQHFIKELKTRL